MEPIASSSASHSTASATTAANAESTLMSSKASPGTWLAVITRDGGACWLCRRGSIAVLVAAHQIPASSEMEEVGNLIPVTRDPDMNKPCAHTTFIVFMLLRSRDYPQAAQLPGPPI